MPSGRAGLVSTTQLNLLLSHLAPISSIHFPGIRVGGDALGLQRDLLSYSFSSLCLLTGNPCVGWKV